MSSDLLNVLGHGRREDHRLRIRHVALNFHDVLLEAHVKHLVALVQNLELRAAYVKRVVIEQVDEAPRSRDDYLWPNSSDITH